MDSSGNINSDANMRNYEQNQALPESEILNKDLPPEVLSLILSKLRKEDIQSFKSASQGLNKRVIEHINLKQHAIVRNVAKYLIEILKDKFNESQIKSLTDIMNSDRLDNKTFTLVDVKSSIDDFKDQFAGLLNELNEDDFNALDKNLSLLAEAYSLSPSSFEEASEDSINFGNNLIATARAYKKVDEALNESDEEDKISGLSRIISTDLVRLGLWKKIEEVLSSLKEEERDKVCQNTIKFFANSYNLDLAIAEKFVPYLTENGKALGYAILAQGYVLRWDFEKANEFCNKILADAMLMDEYFKKLDPAKDSTLSSCATICIVKGLVDEAKMFADQIVDLSLKDNSLSSLPQAAGEQPMVTDLKNLAINYFEDDKYLTAYLEKLADKGDFKKIETILASVPDALKEMPLREISVSCAKKRRCYQCRKIYQPNKERSNEEQHINFLRKSLF